MGATAVTADGGQIVAKEATPSGTARNSPTILAAVFLGLTLLIGFTRIPLAPTWLFLFDDVNLALALDDFNPGLQKPQPPGYPMFVVQARLLRVFFGTVERTFLVCGMLAGVLAPFFLFLLGARMYSRWTGVTAALLLTLSPVFWFSSLVSPLRPYIALISALSAYLCYRAASGEPRFAYYAAIAVGLGAGWRPSAVVFLFPLWLLCAWFSLRSVRRLAIALLLMAASVLLWLGPMTADVGGPAALYKLFAEYLADNSHRTSLLYGAGFWEWSRTMVQALVWLGLPVVGWVWACPLLLAGRNRSLPASAQRDPTAFPGSRPLPVWLFYLAWLLPPAIFFGLVHVEAPGHTLYLATGSCLMGAACLDVAARRAARCLPGGMNPRYSFVAIALGLYLVLFFFPYQMPPWRHSRGTLLRFVEHCGSWGQYALRGSSYTPIREDGQITDGCLSFLRALGRTRPLVIVWQDYDVSWREVAYYWSDTPMWMISGLTALERRDGLVPQLCHENRVVDRPDPAPPVRLPVPAGGRVAWLVHELSRLPEQLRAHGVPMRQFGSRLFVTDLASAPTQFRAAQFVFEQERGWDGN
jgi:4-amino-4-deoxy-L-arabinose transferase-like glycosyltransferase